MSDICGRFDTPSRVCPLKLLNFLAIHTSVLWSFPFTCLNIKEHKSARCDSCQRTKHICISVFAIAFPDILIFYCLIMFRLYRYQDHASVFKIETMIPIVSKTMSLFSSIVEPCSKFKCKAAYDKDNLYNGLYIYERHQRLEVKVSTILYSDGDGSRQ